MTSTKTRKTGDWISVETATGDFIWLLVCNRHDTAREFANYDAARAFQSARTDTAKCACGAR
jgi:hypothetical protein